MPWQICGDTDLPIADIEMEWDGAAAAARVFAWAGFDGEEPDTDRARQAFFACDSDDLALRGNYKLGFADIVGDELTAVPRGIFAVAGGRGVNAADLPADVKTAVKARVRGYYGRMEMEPPDSVKHVMHVERKTLPQFTKEINGRTVTGIFAVHGNVDDGGDMSIPGSFARRLMNGDRKRTRFLWNHDSWNPPIASIKEIREIGRAELPAKVLQYAPDATGGVLVTREYYSDVPLADWVLAGIRAGDIDEMSYAYDVHDYGMEDRDGRKVRIMKDVELFDISDVNWGMNPATAGVKGLGDGLTFMQHGEAVVSTLSAYVDRVKDRHEFRQKEGRVLSGANRERLSTMLEMIKEIADDMEGLLEAASPVMPEMMPDGENGRQLADYLKLRARALSLRLPALEN